jgi:hypothetical protein
MVRELPTSADWEVARILVEEYFLQNTQPSCAIEAIAMELIFQSIAKLKGVEASVIRNQAIATQLKCMSRGDEAERPRSMAVGSRHYTDVADLPRGHQQ